jgi:hypothetical protein
VDYWYAPEHGEWGENLTVQIDRQIAVRDRVLLVCSENSLHDSGWVQWEIEQAFGEQKKRNKTVIYPIMIDNSLTEWDHPRATQIKEVLAADFRKATRGEAFTLAAARLLESLKVTD